MKKSLSIIFIICFAFVCSAQNNTKCTIYSVAGDTIQGEYVSGFYKKFKCRVDGKVSTYRPRKVLKYTMDGKNYHSGKFPMIFGIKKWGYGTVLIAGKINMYGLYTTQVSNNGGFVRLQNVSRYYVRKGNNDRGNFLAMGLMSKSRLKRIGKDCPNFIEEMENWKYTLSTIKGMVNFYNSECN